jgi:hypothetical protein
VGALVINKIHLAHTVEPRRGDQYENHFAYSANMIMERGKSAISGFRAAAREY